MIWINKFLLFMSLSGSVALLLYYLAKTFFGRYLSAGCRYLLLKMCMCFYLLPVPLLSGDIRSIIRIFIPDFSYGVDPWEVWISDFSHTIYDTPDGYRFPGFSWPAMLLLIVWLAVVTVILTVQYRNYRKVKQLTKSIPQAVGRLDESSRQMQHRLKLHRKITTYVLDEKFPPFCYGIFHPRIVIPSEYGTEETDLILQHEMQHIKSLDFFFRGMTFLIIALHFFNPLVYLLSYEIGKVSEFACDEKVLKGCSDTQQDKYGQLLLETTIISPVLTYTNSFSGNNKRTMKERIAMMKHPRKTKFAVLICCALLIAVSSMLPAAAYELPTVEYSAVSDTREDGSSYMFSTEAPALYADPNEAYFSISDCFFIDEEGNPVFDLDDSLISPRSTCAHTYVSGYIYEHTLNGSGGCTYTTYSAKRCTKCGAITNKTFISSTSYAVCPHK